MEVETAPEAGGSSGSGSWCEGDAEGEGEGEEYGSGDSLAEDAALLGEAHLPPRILRNQKRDVAVDLHLLQPDV